jgi:hypothetical protein
LPKQSLSKDGTGGKVWSWQVIHIFRMVEILTSNMTARRMKTATLLSFIIKLYVHDFLLDRFWVITSSNEVPLDAEDSDFD